jgi:CubicO group peptidase (beta-lactamase class C family)
MMTMKLSIKIVSSVYITFFTLIALSFTNNSIAEETSHSPDWWPPNGWRSSTPEEQGMDSAKLADMFEYINEKGLNIDSVNIVRNGYIVTDAYLNPLFKPGMKHILHSCTKSITSALIGIAIDKGYIKGVDELVFKFFPKKQFAHMDERKRAVTIEHLLTMSHGIRNQDSFIYKWQGLFEMRSSKDWVRFILDQPMDVVPGTRFDYSNGSSFLLSAIIHKQINASTLSFARKYLFEPLGITDVKWPSSPNGITEGWGQMWLTPHDMAKIGWLYLNSGRWDNRQIVPIQWVRDSTKKHAFPKSFRRVNDKNGDLMLIKSLWLWKRNRKYSFFDGYGYQWWIDDSGFYSARGAGGQYIMVVPEKNMVVVFTSVLKGSDHFIPGRLLKKYIIPSVLSDKAISPNTKELSRIKSILKDGDDSSRLQTVPPLPKTAKEISGRTYKFDSNQFDYENISFTFQQNKKTALCKIRLKGVDYEAEIGLDNIYRVTETGDKQLAFKGHWSDDKTFLLSYNDIGNTKRGVASITFENNVLKYLINTLIGESELTAQVE